MVFRDGQIVFGAIIVMIQLSQFCRIARQRSTSLGQEFLTQLHCSFILDVRIAVLANADVALQGVEGDDGVFTPRPVCELKNVTAPAELIQVSIELFEPRRTFF